MPTQMLKTLLFLGLLTVLILFLGESIGGRQGLLLSFVIALGINFMSYFYSDGLMLWTYGARKLEGADSYKLNQLVDQVAKKAEIPSPRIYLIPTDTLNAFAIGRSPRSASIVLTQGLLKLLSKDELEAVVAHEIGHVQRFNTFLMMTAAMLGSLIMFVSQFLKWVVSFGQTDKMRKEFSSAVSAFLNVLVAPFAAVIIQLAVSKNRMYLADQTAVELTGKPQALASALWKIHNYSLALPMPATEATSHMFIINPLNNKGWARIFSTHPPIETRIKKLIGRTL